MQLKFLLLINIIRNKKKISIIYDNKIYSINILYYILR